MHCGGGIQTIMLSGIALASWPSGCELEPGSDEGHLKPTGSDCSFAKGSENHGLSNMILKMDVPVGTQENTLC
jgi:hypothetical protein